MYALVVVSILKNVQKATQCLTFKNSRFGPNLAQMWPNLVQIKACKDWHHVGSALEVLMNFKNMIRLKILSLGGQK